MIVLQGLVNLEDTDQDGDASLELVPRSHFLHENLQQLTGDPELPKGDWYKFPQEVKEKIQTETAGGILSNLCFTRSNLPQEQLPKRKSHPFGFFGFENV